MKTNKIRRLKVKALIFSLMFISFSCKKQEHKDELAGPDEYYSCSMDPQVIENKAGNCPICHMKLIKVKANNHDEGQIKLSDQQIRLGNINWDTVRYQVMAKEISVTGRITVNQNLTNTISAKVQGRIQKLAIKNAWDYIKVGQLLFEIYSEDLNNTQMEYLRALSSGGPENQFGAAAKNKLLLYGMSESQINALKISNQILQYVPVFSTIQGYISDISVSEGNYVSEGAALFQVTSLHSLWVEAQVYLPYLSYITIGTEANISIPAVGQQLFHGKVIFIEPQVKSPERFVLVRFQISNASQLIKPGMLAYVILRTERKKALVISSEAIIQNSNGTHVWLRDKGGVFVNKMIKVGLRNNRLVEIIDGLKGGDVVVISGAYLLNSEYIFKKGSQPMQGHMEMPGMKM